MPVPMPRNVRYLLAALLAVAGLGLLVHGLAQWRALPAYSEADITASTELNLQIDLAQLRRARNPSDVEIGRMRAAVRAEVEAEIAARREAAQTSLSAGAALLVIAMLQALLQRFLPDRRASARAT